MKRLIASLLLLISSSSPAPAQVSGKATYYAGVFSLASPSGATDAMCLENPAGVVVRLLQIYVSGLGAGAATIDVALVKRASLNSGGTSTTVTPAIGDAGAAAQAALRSWTV